MIAALAITNSEAGSTDQQAIDQALEILRETFEIRVEATSSPEELDEILVDATTVLVLGGDGSLHAVVNALARIKRLSDVTIGQVPLGTGNDFARGIAMPLDVLEAARIITERHEREIDMIVDADECYVINAVHIGAGAQAAVEARPWKKAFGKAGYAVGALISGIKHPSFDLQITIDGDPLPAGNGVLQIAINNGAFIGGGTPLGPDADPSDGLLDVAVSYAIAPISRLDYARQLRRGDHVDREDVLTWRASSVEVRGEAFLCSADGEIQDSRTYARWDVLPGAVRMFVPPAPPFPQGRIRAEAED